MKRNILIGCAAALCLTGSLASCSDDYLQLEPVTSITSATTYQSTKAARYAVNGIAFIMGKFSSNVNIRTMYGEAAMASVYGEGLSQDYFSLSCAMVMSGRMLQMDYMGTNNTWWSANAWAYYYTIVNDCNKVLDGLNESTVESEAGELKFVKAQLLTFRAHAYVKLLQIFGPRWSDSNNGERLAIVLRTTSSTEAKALSSVNEVLAQIYTDMDQAIEYFQDADASKLTRTNCAEPNLGVAYGTYARAALLKNDWATAETMANKAQEGHSIMTNDQFLSGFMTENSDYMWTNSIEQTDDSQYGNWGSFYACNGAYPVAWSIGAGTINIDLYNEVYAVCPTDIRLKQFIMPQTLTGTGVTAAHFWDDGSTEGDYVTETDMNLLCKKDNGAYKQLRWSRAILAFANDIKPEIPSWASSMSDAYLYSGTQGGIYFGSQFKFWGADNFWRCQFPYMRSTEMLLIEAEAAAQQGKTQTAQQLINKLAQTRCPEYAGCTVTGDELLNFIRLQRRIELWGEGFNFFDFKRWNLPIVRRAWVRKDQTSGNIPAMYSGTLQPEDGNHWTAMIPLNELQYNSLINEADLRKW